MATSTADRPRVLVVGTGAMASLFGARLARGGLAEVRLAGTWAAALEAIRQDGLTVHEAGGRWSVPVGAASLDELATAEAADLVLVLVKSHRTAGVAGHAARAVAPEGLVLTLQNGLGNREVLARAAGAGRTAQGVTSVGASIVAPGHVRPGGPGVTALGAEPANPAAVGRAAALLTAAGIRADVTDNLERLVWRKLAVNAAINPLSALFGVPNGALLEGPQWPDLLEEAAREVGAVAAARGIALGEDAAALAAEVARSTAANRSSMLQDMDRGAPTEIEAITGAVVAEARRLGVRVPVNEALLAAVRAVDAGEVSRVEAAVQLMRAVGVRAGAG